MSSPPVSDAVGSQTKWSVANFVRFFCNPSSLPVNRATVYFSWISYWAIYSHLVLANSMLAQARSSSWPSCSFELRLWETLPRRSLPAPNSSSPHIDTDMPLHSSPLHSPTTLTRSNGIDTPPDSLHTHAHAHNYTHNHNRTQLRPRQPAARVTLTSYAPTDQSFYFEPITFNLIEHGPPMILCRANKHTSGASATGNRISFASRVVSRGNHAQIYFDHERVGNLSHFRT